MNHYRTLSIATILVISLNITKLAAQDSYSILQNMSHITNTQSAISGNFNLIYNDGGIANEQDGTFTIQNNYIKVENSDVLLFSDGEDRWICNKLNEEIVVAKEDTAATSIISNPWLIFQSLENNAAYSYPKKYKTEIINGIRCGVIVLKEKKSKDSAYTIYIDLATKLPIKADYVINKNTTAMSISFDSYNFESLKELTFFVPSSEILDSYYITDLR